MIIIALTFTFIVGTQILSVIQHEQLKRRVEKIEAKLND